MWTKRRRERSRYQGAKHRCREISRAPEIHIVAAFDKRSPRGKGEKGWQNGCDKSWQFQLFARNWINSFGAVSKFIYFFKPNHLSPQSMSSLRRKLLIKKVRRWFVRMENSPNARFFSRFELSSITDNNPWKFKSRLDEKQAAILPRSF